MNANQLINAMINYEMDRENPPDGRRVVRDERMALQVTLQRYQQRPQDQVLPSKVSRQEAAQHAELVKRQNRAPSADDLSGAITEATRVLDMWRAEVVSYA